MPELPRFYGIHRVTAFEVVAPYTLKIVFSDGLSRVIALEGVLAGELYGPLKDPALFQSVSLDTEVHTLVWPNGADFDPSILHDWPEHEPAFLEMARSTASVLAG